jgi:hypothetical protein
MEMVMTKSELLFGHLPWGGRGGLRSTTKYLVRIVDVLARTQTNHFPNTKVRSVNA